MTPEEKVALLKKAGVWDVIGYPTCIDKLFELVAANEREACAKVCDIAMIPNPTTSMFDAGVNSALSMCAAAIRARGEK